MGVKQLSDGGPDGTKLGQSASDLIGLYGATPVARFDYSSAISGASITSLVPLSGGSNYGFSTSDQVEQVQAFMSAVRTTLTDMGIWPTTA